MKKRNSINHNDLLPWFLEDHGQLPDAYVKSCQKFFDKLQSTSEYYDLEYPSHKHQATSLPQSGDRITKNRKE